LALSLGARPRLPIPGPEKLAAVSIPGIASGSERPKIGDGASVDQLRLLPQWIGSRVAIWSLSGQLEGRRMASMASRVSRPRRQDLECLLGGISPTFDHSRMPCIVVRAAYHVLLQIMIDRFYRHGEVEIGSPVNRIQ